jgi:hypothetical protein
VTQLIPRLVTLSETIEKARRCVAEMEAFGIRPPNGSRVLLYLKALDKWLAWRVGHKDGDTIQRFVLGLQEISLLVQTFNWLKVPPEVPRWRDEFQKILDGPYFPSNEADKPRDTQAELCFAGGAKSVGYRVELGDPDLQEPDVILLFENHRYAVEAKRPRSIDTVKDNVEDAADQIARRDLDGGLIFLDLSVALAEAKREILSPNAKMAEPWQMETPDKVPFFINLRRQYVLDLLSLARTYIPQSLAHRVLGISAIFAETVFIGPAGPQLPPAFPTMCWVNLPLSPSGEHLYGKFKRDEPPKDFESRPTDRQVVNARADQRATPIVSPSR